jgi:hypothetical protein
MLTQMHYDGVLRPKLCYSADWPMVLNILQHAQIRRLAKYAAMWQWVMGRCGEAVTPELCPTYARIFLPQYRGPALTLYRGCVEGNERRINWTKSVSIARHFALSRTDFMSEKLVVRTIVPASAIICDTCEFMRKGAEEEVILDPTMLGEIEVIESYEPGSHRVRTTPPAAKLRVSLLKWGERLREQEATIPITATPPETKRLARALRGRHPHLLAAIS